MIELTSEGKIILQIFLDDCKKEREYLVDNKIDTAEGDYLPTTSTIISHIERFEIDNEFCHCYDLTDNYNTRVLRMKRGEHYN